MSYTLNSEQALWWQKGVVYQIYPRSFKDSNGDGVGDLDGITSRLDYLVSLGIDAIWLSPFYKSPMADFGYDVADYCDVDPIFGDLAAFDRLVAEAHARDIRVIVDYVPNHSSDQHPWFLESRSSRSNPKRDWYVWANPKNDGTAPNNWLGLFGGQAWEYDARTDQYYLHSFLREQPDLNWRNPEVEQAMLDVLKFWLERGVDGFRIDVAHFIMKDPMMRDNPVNITAVGNLHKPLGNYDRQHHPYDKGHPDVHGVFRKMRRLFDQYSAAQPRYSVGEIHVFDWDDWATYYGKNLDELHMPFNFGLVNLKWDAAHIRRVVEGIEAALAKLPPGAWPNYVLGNHDEPRIASRVGMAQARVAMMLLLTLRGTPTVYYGDELGMQDVYIPPEKEKDPWKQNNRDPERTPMQWDASPNAGFSPEGVETWLPLADNYVEVNVAVQMNNSRSMLALTQRLLMLRRGVAALSVGTYASVDGMPTHVFAFTRQYESQRWMVILNTVNEDCTIDFSAYPGGNAVLSTHMDRDGAVASSFVLRGNEGLLIEF